MVLKYHHMVTSFPVNRAARYGCKKMVVALIDRKASVSAVDKYGSTALHLACEAGHGDIAKV